MTIKNQLQFTDKQLKSGLETEILACFVLDKSKEWLISNLDQEFPKDKVKNLNKLVKRRLAYEPIAYLVNTKEFYALDFKVNKRVLIPRPETELLVDLALKDINKHRYSNIIELGTGSGCISVAIAKNTSKTKISATDICKRALKVAQFNAKKHKVVNKIDFVQSDIFANPKLPRKHDLIIANLPYLDTDMKNLLKSSDSKALKFEPRKALDGGTDGTKIYQQLFKEIKEKEIKFKLMLIEIGGQHSEKMKKLAQQAFPNKKIEIIKDLATKNRILKIL